jgi:hypothetical protein
MKVIVAVLGSLVLVATPSWAKPRSVEWFYGTAWWEEFEDDERTALLVHFGKPQARHERAQAVEKKGVRERKDAEARTEAELQTADEGAAEDGGRGDAKIEVSVEKVLEEEPIEPIQDDDLPPDAVLDYRVHDRRKVEGRLRSKVQGGAAIVDVGRFGKGLKCVGGASGVRFDNIAYEDGRSVECSFKLARYPRKTRCILSANKDEGQVLLHPDGRLELKLKKPHGTPSQGHWKKEFYDAIFTRDATIMSRDPVPLDEWLHVVAAMKPVVVQGAGSPFCAALIVNGVEKASYTSEVNNDYSFLGRWSHKQGQANLVIGNNEEMNMGLEGLVDEVRISKGDLRVYYERPPLAWRDANGERKLDWDWPYFHRDGMVVHADLDGHTKAERCGEAVRYVVFGEEGTPGYVEGIRGEAAVAGKNLGYLRVPLKGMSALQGSVEFWFRPQNWDNTLGYWSPDGPPRGSDLSVARFVGRDKGTGNPVVFIETGFSRAHAIDHGRKVILDPGHWRHVVVGWYAGDMQRAFTFVDGKWHHGSRRTVPEEVTRNIEPLYVEFGVSNDEKARIEVDEVVGYDYFLSNEELVTQAMSRWMGTLEPLRQYEMSVRYKWSVGKLSASITTKNILNDTADSVELRLVRREETDSEDRPVAGPFRLKLEKGAAAADLYQGSALEPGTYHVTGHVLGASGKKVVDVRETERIRREAWRDNKLGYLDRVPPPWTPIALDAAEAKTRMIRYQLAKSGLPEQIVVAGEPILAGPMAFLEGEKPLAGSAAKTLFNKETEAAWEGLFESDTAAVGVNCHIEYEGLVKFTLQLRPKGDRPAGPIALAIPVRANVATHWFYNLAGQTGIRTGYVGEQEGQVLSSRLPALWHEQWKAKRSQDAQSQKMVTFADIQQYAFFTQFGVCNLDRGLYWFADNAAGWQQSKARDAQEVVRRGDVAEVRLNLLAEPVTLDKPRTIVFGLLPFPARPMPEKWRKFDRAAAQDEPLYCSISGAFMPWPMEPRTHGMQLFPAPDPKAPEAGPSYAYARQCAEHFAKSYSHGFRMMYLSNYWYSCRAGAFDHWEWRCGPTSQATLSQSFVDYLVWEMDQWISNEVFTGIYLDECYEAPSQNVECGDAVVLPDGSVQAGLNLWGFRDLMKRWRNLFHKYDKPPMILGHLTGSFMYPGMVFCDAFLDGEGHPTITASGGSFIDHTSRDRLEVLNSQHWGVAPFYMVSIWEGGLGKGKGWNPHTRWSWRMARSAMARLLPFENGTMYTDQGSHVYRSVANDIARFGADANDVAFYPYWRNADYFRLEPAPKSPFSPEPDTKGVIVSFYRKDQRLLAIVCNWDRKNKDVLLTFDHRKLGLPDTLAVTGWDSSEQPEPGSLDIHSSEEVKKMLGDVKPEIDLQEETKGNEELSLDAGHGEDETVEDIVAGGKTAREAQQFQVRLDDKGRIFVRLRKHDFRMFVVGPPPSEATAPEEPEN